MGRRRRHSPYERRDAVRAPYERVLLVCEGSKTEPNYLQAMSYALRLSSASISIVSPGADPYTLVEYARPRLDEFDKVFCVFDRDNPARFNLAVGAIRESQAYRDGKWSHITSSPCFEIWLLLHFGYSTAPFENADRVRKALSKHLPGYEKGDPGIYAKVANLTATAITNGVKLARYNEQSRANNPSTEMHRLVNYLMNLRR